MTIAHLSDLHLGKSPNQRAVCLALRNVLSECGPDYVIVTGDITEHGLSSELAVQGDLFRTPSFGEND
jgi:3',5'-cyclic AMP phosphodiesterase CpdA